MADGLAMSIREARLCDHPECNHPAEGVCPLCKRDCCKQHSSSNYLAVAVMIGRPDQHGNVSCIGRGGAISVCADCHGILGLHSKVLNFGQEGPLSLLVASMNDKLIEATGAFLAEQKLKPTG